MNDLQFDDSLQSPAPGNGSLLYSRFQKSDKRPSMVNFLITKGIIKSEKAANNMLLALSALFLLSSFGVIYYFFYYTPSAPAGQRNLPVPVQIMQKTNEYVQQGIDPTEARQRATQEVMNAEIPTGSPAPVK
ncbi:MAG: hypothetical protein WCQ00_03820 [bacterium]